MKISFMKPQQTIEFSTSGVWQDDTYLTQSRRKRANHSFERKRVTKVTLDGNPLGVTSGIPQQK
jgi:hypothetical protein